MNTPSEPLPHQVVLKPSSVVSRPSGAGQKLLVALAAFALVATSIAGYCYHRFQMAAIAAQHLRLLVTGPSALLSGVPAVFEVRTSEVTGEPASTAVEFDLYSADGKIPFSRRESTDQRGRLQIRVPGDLSLSAAAVLKVRTRRAANVEEMSVRLEVYPGRLITELSLDRPLYQPGETIFYRSLTLSCFNLAAERETAVRYEILDPSGAALPNSRFDATTEHGVGNGAFGIPDDLPGGQYTLVVRGADEAFSEQRQKFLIRRYRSPRLKKELQLSKESYATGDTVSADFSVKRQENEPAAGARLHVVGTVDGQILLDKNAQADQEGKFHLELRLPEKIAAGNAQLAVTVSDGGARETISKTIPISLGKVEARFYPEGGDLAAGLENRVYFGCRDALGKPLHISGVIESERGRTMAAVETISDGMGQFAFTPQVGESYRLKIISPAGVKDELKLPAAAGDCPIALATGAGVFGPQESLEFNVRSSKGSLPLVVAAWSRGIMVGQVPLVTKKSENGMNSVELPLGDEVAGIVRLTVFDYSGEPSQSMGQSPKPLAERLVYRHPGHRLNIRAADVHDRYAPGEKVNISLSVSNENNEPVAAALGVSLVDEALFALAGDRTPTVTARFLLASQMLKPEDLENADFCLSDDKTAAVPPAVALDLLLGTQGWRKFAEQSQPQKAEGGADHGRAGRLREFSDRLGPPLVSDNLGRIREDYESKLAAYYADRSQVLYTVVTISFLGAWGLLLLVFMLGLLRIVRGAAFWLPVLGMIVCCTITEALLVNPLRFSGDIAQPVPFMSYPVANQAAPTGQGADAGKSGEAQRSPVAKPTAPSTAQPAPSAAVPGLPAQLELVVPRSGAARSERGQAGPAEGDKSGRITVRQYAHQHVASEGGVGGDFAESLFWNSLLISGADGKASLSFDLPDSIAKFRLQADASAAGRLGSMRMDISTEGRSKNKAD
jgi:alpha-2-macroglobulin-like protein